MTNLFKKTLVAVAVLSVAGVANAATLNVEGVAVATANASLEAAVNKSVLKIDTQLAGTKTATGDVGIELGTVAALQVGDIISIKVSGGTFVQPTGAGVPTIAFADLANAAIATTATYDAAKSSSTEALFTVTAVAGALASAPLSNLYVNVSGATAGSKLSITSQIVRPGQATAVDSYPVSPAAAVAVYEFKSQYALSAVTGFDAVVSTGDKRLSFSTTSPAGHSADQDVLAYTLTDNAYAFSNTITQTTTAIKGDFAYMAVADNKTFNPAANADGKLQSAEIATLLTFTAPVGITASYAVSDDYKTLTITEQGNSHTGARTLALKTPKSVAGADAAKAALATALAPATFTATFTGITNPLVAALSYTAKAGTDSAVGSWGLDGSSTFVNYMPYGDAISQMIYATNNGSVDGSVTVSGYDEAGKKYGPYKLATVKAKSVLNLSGLIKDKLVADGVKTGKVALTIDTDAPSVVIYGAYNVGGTDRALVINK